MTEVALIAQQAVEGALASFPEAHTRDRANVLCGIVRECRIKLQGLAGCEPTAGYLAGESRKAIQEGQRLSPGGRRRT